MVSNRISMVVVLCMLLALSAFSCGYRFSPGGENIDKSIRNIYVDNFANRTPEAGLENTIRNSLVDQFRKSSRFKLAESKEQADAVLRGSLNNLSTTHLSYSKADVAKEDRATIVLEVVFEKRANKEIIWSNSSFSWYRDFAIDQTNPITTDNNRRAALQLLSDDAADRVYRSIMSGF